MRALDGVKQAAEFVRPRTLGRLREAGAVNAWSPVAVAWALPWLVGRGPSLGVVSHMNALTVATKPALHDRHGTLTWRQLDARANQAARALGAAGLAGGDAVALLLRNGREFAELVLGAQKAGIVAYPLNTWATPKELEATLATPRPRLVVYDAAHSDAVDEAVPGHVRRVVTGGMRGAPAGTVAYEDFLDGHPGRPQMPVSNVPSTPKVVIHTSGTTGTPKGAARDASAAGLGALADLLRVVPYRRDDVILCPAPLFHSFGLATFTFATALGATLVLPEKFDAEESLALIEEHRATAASFVPVMIKRILELDTPIARSYDLGSLRIVLASGSVLPRALRDAARDLFGDVLYDLYGSTEAGWVAIATPADMVDRPKSVGRPVPGIGIAIFSESGRVRPGETGEIHVRSRVTFDGYTSGEKRRERGGFLSTGDLGFFDDDGYLYIEGRTDDMAVIGGENVYPAEVEQTIEAMDRVADAAVFAVPDEEFGEVLVAFAVGEASVEEIEDHCRRELASYKVPRRIEIVTALPRTATGKILKRELLG